MFGEGRMESTAPLSWEDLPAGVLEIIFSKIENQQHLGLLRLVNSSWRNVVNQSLKSLETSSGHCVGDVESLGKTFTRLEKLKIYSKDEEIFHKISSVKSLTNLHLHSVYQKSSMLRSNGLELLTNLSELKIFARCGELESNFMEMLVTLSNLKSLSLRNRWIDDRSIEQLSAMTNLTMFKFDHFDLKSVSFLSGLTNLEVLVLKNSFRWGSNPNVSFLSSLVNLTRLNLDNYDFETSIYEDSLAKLKNLTWLAIKRGWVSECNLATLTGLSKLTHLDLSRNPLTDEGVRFLMGLSKLTHLDLSLNEVNDEGVRLLTGLVSLKRLFLNWTRAKTTIQILAPLTRLAVLHLDEIPIKGTDLVGLSNLVGLKEVNVHRSEIERGESERVSAALPYIKFMAKFKGSLFPT